MAISREEFGKRYRRILRTKFQQVHDKARIDQEYDAYVAIADFVGVDSDIDMTEDSSGHVRVLVTPRFQEERSTVSP
ncbi:MAG TPA: hypothetical protein VMB73_13820 [Acetobacteraceae bacterium]|jgi:hypothetical protein|nr:hypothetical protein [Acetobacteraceae bacterium]